MPGRGKGGDPIGGSILAPLRAPDQANQDACLARLAAILDEPRLAAAWAEGRAMDLDDAIALARRGRS